MCMIEKRDEYLCPMTYLTFIKLKLLIKNRHEPCHTFKHFNIYKAKVHIKRGFCKIEIRHKI